MGMDMPSFHTYVPDAPVCVRWHQVAITYAAFSRWSDDRVTVTLPRDNRLPDFLWFHHPRRLVRIQPTGDGVIVFHSRWRFWVHKRREIITLTAQEFLTLASQVDMLGPVPRREVDTRRSYLDVTSPEILTPVKAVIPDDLINA